MSNNDKIEIVVPASIIDQVKEGLIKVGYADESTDPEFVQDCYFKWVMVNQAGFNPNMPYAICLLPKTIQQALGYGDGTEPTEPTNPGALFFRIPESAKQKAIVDAIVGGTYSPAGFTGLDSSVLHTTEEVEYKKTSIGTEVVLASTRLIQGQDETTVSTTKSLLIILEVVGLTPEIRGALLNEETPTKVYLFESGSWGDLPYAFLDSYIAQFTDGKYYAVIPSNTLDREQGATSAKIALDEDGEGTEKQRVECAFALLYGGALVVEEPPALTDITFKHVDAANYYMVLESAFLSNWVSSVSGSPADILNPNSIDLTDRVGGGYNVFLKDARLIANISDKAVALSKTFYTMFELEGLTKDIYDQALAGTSEGLIYTYSPTSGTWVGNSFSALFGYYVGLNPMDNKYYMLIPQTTMNVGGASSSVQYFGIDADGPGSTYVRHEIDGTFYYTGKAEPADDGLLKLKMPTTAEAQAMYSEIASGDWSDAMVNQYFNSGSRAITPASVATISVTPEGYYNVNPVDKTKFSFGANTVQLTEHIAPLLYELINVTQSEIEALIAGTSDARLLTWSGSNPAESLDPTMFAACLKQRPSTGAWYVVLYTQVAAYTASAEFAALDITGNGLDSFEPAMPASLLIPISSKPAELPAFTLTAVDRETSYSLNTQLRAGIISMPAGLGIEPSDIIDHSDSNWELGTTKNVYLSFTPTPLYNLTGMHPFKSYLGTAYSAPYTDMETRPLADNKVVLSFLKLNGVVEGNATRSFDALCRGQTPFTIMRFTDLRNNFGDIITGSAASSEAEIEAIKGKFIIEDGYDKFLCTVHRIIGTPSTVAYAIARDGIIQGSAMATGFYPMPSITYAKGATVDNNNEVLTYQAGATLPLEGGGTIEGFGTFNQLPLGSFYSLDLANLLNSTDANLKFDMDIMLCLPDTSLLLLDDPYQRDASYSTPLVNIKVDNTLGTASMSFMNGGVEITDPAVVKATTKLMFSRLGNPGLPNSLVRATYKENSAAWKYIDSRSENYPGVSNFDSSQYPNIISVVKIHSHTVGTESTLNYSIRPTLLLN